VSNINNQKIGKESKGTSKAYGCKNVNRTTMFNHIPPPPHYHLKPV
jgi:hypothetical protein